MRTAVAICAFLALLAMTGPVVKAQNATYPNIMAALSGANLSGLATLVRLAGLDEDLSDPDLAITLFAPSNAAVAEATAQLTAAQVNLTQIVPVILLYHAAVNSSITFRDDIVLPTFLATANLTNTTTSLTVLQVTNNTWYLGGIIPGAEFNLTSRINAGKSQIYVINSVLVPPSGLFGVPLTVNELLATTPGFSVLASLIRNDTAIFNATADPNLAVTIFAPTDAAFNAFFRANNVTLAQVAGTATARRILLNHIYPDYPVTSFDLAMGVQTASSASLNDTITLNKTMNGTRPVITVRGAGNSAAIPILTADVPAAMSAVHVIGGVILPRPANTTTTGK